MLARQTQALLAALPDSPPPISAGEIEELLRAIPDMRTRLRSAAPADLVEILRAFDVEVRYNHNEKTLEISACLATPDGPPQPQQSRLLVQNVRDRLEKAVAGV